MIPNIQKPILCPWGQSSQNKTICNSSVSIFFFFFFNVFKFSQVDQTIFFIFRIRSKGSQIFKLGIHH